MQYITCIGGALIIQIEAYTRYKYIRYIINACIYILVLYTIHLYIHTKCDFFERQLEHLTQTNYDTKMYYNLYTCMYKD